MFPVTAIITIQIKETEKDMKLPSSHKMHIDLKDGDWRVVFVKADNSILKVMGSGLEKEAIAQRVADDWNQKHNH
jgi:hypothetical protein